MLKNAFFQIPARMSASTDPTALFLQMYGSPFTDISRLDAAPKIPDRFDEPTQTRYWRRQSTITCDGSGAFEIIAPSNPYQCVMPLMFSDMPLSTTNFSTGNFAGTNLRSWWMNNQGAPAAIINGPVGLAKFGGILQAMMNDPPAAHRILAMGIRVWSLEGSDGQQGLIRACPIDTSVMNQIFSGQSNRHGWQSAFAGAENPVNILDNTQFFNEPIGVFRSTNPTLPSNLDGILSPSYNGPPYNQASWQAYLKSVGNFCEYPGEYKIFPGSSGVSIRGHFTSNNIGMTQFSPKCLLYPATFPLLMSTTHLTADPQTSTWIPQYHGAQLGEVLPCRASVETSTASTASYHNNGAQGTGPAGTGHFEHLLSYDCAVNVTNEWQFDEEDVNMTSCRISGTNFDAGAVLFVEFVYCFEETTTDKDNIMARPSPVDPDFEQALALADNRDSFPIVVSGHSFFSNVWGAVKKAAQFVSANAGTISKIATFIA